MQNGKRHYLDPIIDHAKRHERLSKIHGYSKSQDYRVAHRTHKRFSLINPNGQKPLMKIEYLGGTSKEDKSRCVIMFASFNTDYIDDKDYHQKLLDVVQDLKEVGFKGHVIYRLGLYPLIEQGSIRMVHIPYSFKVLAFLEAYLMGYSSALWIDCSIHPLNDLSTVFSFIENNGLYILRAGSNLSKRYQTGYIPDHTLNPDFINHDNMAKIQHLLGGIVGISFESKRGMSFL